MRFRHSADLLSLSPVLFVFLFPDKAACIFWCSEDANVRGKITMWQRMGHIGKFSWGHSLHTEVKIKIT